MINYKKKKESRLLFWRFIRNTENKTELRTGTDKSKKFCIQYGYSMVNTDCNFFLYFSGVFVVVVSLFDFFFFSALWKLLSHLKCFFYPFILLSGTNPVHIIQKHSVEQVSH